jgi:secondary thiamine-phosphate synthase enzyme
VIRIATRHPTEFIDITEQAQSAVRAANLDIGLANIQTLHTTTALLVNEHEPLLIADFEATLERLVPVDAHYRHDSNGIRTVNVVADERPNGHAHCRSLLLTPNACLNIAGGRLLLGQWQRVFLVELDGPRERAVTMVIIGTPTSGRGESIRKLATSGRGRTR